MNRMKKAKNILLILLTAAVIAVSFFIPDNLLGYSDRKNGDAGTNEIDAVTLNVKKELSLIRKMYITAFGTKIASKNGAATNFDVERTVKDFFVDLAKCMGLDVTPEILSFESSQCMAILGDTGESFIVWDVLAHVGFVNTFDFHFFIDDISMQILQLDAYSYPVGGDYYENDFPVYSIAYISQFVSNIIIDNYNKFYGDYDYIKNMEYVMYGEDAYNKTIIGDVHKTNIMDDGRNYSVYMIVNDDLMYFGQMSDEYLKPVDAADYPDYAENE